MDWVVYYGQNSHMKNRIKEFREAHGWTMQDLADRLHTTPSTINKLEKGTLQLREKWLKGLVDVFGCTRDEIVGSPSPPVNAHLDAAYLALCLRAVEEVIAEEDISITPEDRADLIVDLYTREYQNPGTNIREEALRAVLRHLSKNRA